MHLSNVTRIKELSKNGPKNQLSKTTTYKVELLDDCAKLFSNKQSKRKQLKDL